MKKQLAFIMAALLALSASALSACSSGNDEKNTDTQKQTDAITTTTTAPVVTEPVTTEAVTEAPKRDSYEYIATYTDGNRSPIDLKNGTSSVAAHFVVKEGFLESVSANCPSWSDDVGNLTMKIYKWDTDYETTIASEPVATETFVDYEDNSTLSIELATEDRRGLEAGEYLWFLGDGEDSSGSGVGIWASAFPEDEEAILGLYKNGKEYTSGPSFECDITIVIPAE